MQHNIPSGQPEKKTEATQIVVPNEALRTLVKLVAFLAFLAALVFLTVNGFDPMTLVPFAPRL
ncbi:hypothetical protein GCM10022224_049910 [Nonomuraea antimicrobica]|uniref:Uncharacterized protein n=1 Tax=Nonomuraea antimicrobica TaxID=561173 RepID=A0ABP7C7B0_9ACTN